MLAWWQYGLWGAFGGVAVEAIELLGATQRANGVPWKKPGELGPGALAITTVIRLGLGAGLAIALAQNNEITGGLGALSVGVSAPLILEQLGKTAATQHRAPTPAPQAIPTTATPEWRHQPEAAEDVPPAPQELPPLPPLPPLGGAPEPQGRSMPLRRRRAVAVAVAVLLVLAGGATFAALNTTRLVSAPPPARTTASPGTVYGNPTRPGPASPTAAPPAAPLPPASGSSPRLGVSISVAIAGLVVVGLAALVVVFAIRTVHLSGADDGDPEHVSRHPDDSEQPKRAPLRRFLAGLFRSTPAFGGTTELSSTER